MKIISLKSIIFDFRNLKMTANKKLNKLKKHIISKFVGIEHLDIKFQKLNFLFMIMI